MKSLTSKILRRLLGRHQGDLLDDARRRRLLRYKRQLEMVDDPVHSGIIHDESDDFQQQPVGPLCTSIRTAHKNRAWPVPQTSQGTSLRLATRPWLISTGEYGGSGPPGKARGPGRRGLRIQRSGVQIPPGALFLLSP
jgi:hypothetical protein